MPCLSSRLQESWQGNLGLVIKTAGSRLLSVHLRNKKLNQFINQHLDPFQINKNMFTRRMFRDIWDTCDPSSEVLMGRSLDEPLGWTGSLEAHNQPRSRWNHFRWSNRGREMTAALLRSHHVCIWRSWDSSLNLSSLLYKNGSPGLMKPQLKIGATSPGSHKSFAKSPSLNLGICQKWEPLPFSHSVLTMGVHETQERRVIAATTFMCVFSFQRPWIYQLPHSQAEANYTLWSFANDRIVPLRNQCK